MLTTFCRAAHPHFDIVKREMIDMVPNAITLTLINHSRQNLPELYKPDVFEAVLQERELVVAHSKEVGRSTKLRRPSCPLLFRH